MLQKFLFVGLGGSGGKTLRFLYEDLQRRLDAIKWPWAMPAAWQFVHIDVPTNADGTSPDLPAQLSRRSYVGLAPSNMTYRDLDEQLARQGEEVLRSVAPWRPRADRVGINPSIGAGQFRAVGRAITAASLKRITERLRSAMDELQDINHDDELSQLSLRLTGDSTVAHEMPPQVILVSSIAGGSGAGTFLDVADIIRHLGSTWGQESVALLYLPDVFADVPEASRVGVTANALASVSELMNAYWADGSLSEEGDLALFTKAGVLVQSTGRRGPRYPMLIGRSNGTVRFASQNEVYRVTAKSLASWITSGHVQDQIRAYVHGNWAQAAEGRTDNTGLTDGTGLEVPFSSIGFGSVGLGRERFAQYARERLAAHALDHLLRAHVSDDVRAELITAEEAVEERARAVRHQFMDRCQLRELGPEDNQILDAIRGGSSRDARNEQLQELRALIRQRIGSGGADGTVDVDRLKQLLLAANAEYTAKIVGEIFEEDAERARTWCRDILTLLIREASLLLGQEGARVTEQVLEDVVNELSQAVIPELNHDEQSATAFSDQTEQRISARFAGLRGSVQIHNRAVTEAVEECVRSAHAKAEARLHQLTASIVADLAENVIEPMRSAIAMARRGLEVEDQGTPEKPSVTKTWTRREVPRVLEPAQNEILLEPVEGYPTTFVSRLKATMGRPDEGGALAAAVAQVIAGVLPGDEESQPSVISVLREWVPREPALSLSQAPSKARMTVHLTAQGLLDRARDWVWAPGTPFSEHIEESLRHYLDEGVVSQQEHAERLDRFKVGLGQAVAASKPLIEIDPSLSVKVHVQPPGINNEAISPIPFPPGHPARQVVKEVFHTRSEEELKRLFHEDDATAVEITTILGANYQPPAIASLAKPIAADFAKRIGQVGMGGFWDRRRTRRLVEFIPMPPDKISAILRGWHVARLLDWIRVGDLNREPVAIWTSRGHAHFPHPLLGPPLADPLDLFPALLESIPLALLTEPERHMPAYWQLEALGSTSYIERSVDAEEARDALRRLVVKGEVLHGAPKPDGVLDHQDVDGRAEWVLGRLDAYVRRYQDLRDNGYKPGRPVSRTWEIAGPLLDAVAALRTDVETMRQHQQDEGAW